MGRLIERSDIVDYQTYEDERAEIRQHIFEVKARRRVHLGENLTFLFENRETLTYQVQEIMRAERIVRESAIRHEIDTYNAMLGTTGQLACALLIEIPDAEDRKPLLTRLMGIQECIYLRLEDGSKSYCSFDPGQVGEDRLSAVQYLIFDAPLAPIAVGSDFDDLAMEVELDEVQKAALDADRLA